MSTPCPAPARIQAYAVGALPNHQQDELRAHFAACAPCRMLSEDFASLESSPASAPSVDRLWSRLQPEWDARRGKRVWWVLPWLAVPVAAAAMLLLFALPAPPGPSIARGRGAAYEADLLARVEPAPIELPAESFLIYRGAAANPSAAELTAAFQAYRQRDYPEAARRFAALSANDSRNYEAALYQGVSLLLAGLPAEAVPVLEHAKALATTQRARTAQWYLALAYLHASSVSPARRELEGLCASGSQSGCDVLRRLGSPPPR